MNVNISEKVESKLKDLATRNGKAVEDFAAAKIAEREPIILPLPDYKFYSKN